MKSRHIHLLSLIICIYLINPLNAQNVEIIKLWETDKLLQTPESIVYYPVKDYLFVSNIAGGSSSKNGQGFISIVNTDATVNNKEWITNLNAPKGMSFAGQTLFVADIDELVLISIDSSKILQKIKVPDAKYLNDVVTDSCNQCLYISDSRAGKIRIYAYHLQTDSISLFFDSDIEKTVNGLFNSKDYLYVGSKSLYRLNKQSMELEKVVNNTKTIDGLEALNDSTFIGTNWNGHIFSLHSNGKQITLENSRALGYNTANVGIDKKNKKIYVPTSGHNTIIAFKYFVK